MDPKINNSLTIISQTSPEKITTLDFVKERFIRNYNLTHKDQRGELQYHRQQIIFNQLLMQSKDLRDADRFSLYACFVTAAVYDWSFDPADNEIYLIPKGGKALIWRQASAHIKRLRTIRAIAHADQVQLVYEGDEFGVEMGKVVRHVEHFISEKPIAAYIRFVLDEKGTEKWFIYRRSDWEAWRKKSPQANGDNWGGATGIPDPGFLRTKIVKHACMDKGWPAGIIPMDDLAGVNVEVDDEEIEYTPVQATPPAPSRKKQSTVIPYENVTSTAKIAVEQMTRQDQQEGIQIDNNDF